MKRILYLLLACFFLAASIAYAADIRWRNSKTALDSISGLQSGDRGIVIGDNGTSQFYRYDGSKWVETPVANAENWATARLIAGNSVNGSANVPFANKFIVQGTSDAGLTGAQFLGALGTGLLKNTTTTGILSIAAAKTDYAPATSGSGILKGDGSGGFAAAAYGDVVGLWTDCTGYLNSDGTCSSPSLSESDPVVAAITGIVKSNGTTISKATAGTDYAPATSGSGVLKGDGAGGFDNATYTDVVGLWTNCTDGFLKYDGSCAAGSVEESDPVVAAITGVVKSNGTTISNAGYSDIVGLWTTCTGYLKSDGTCGTFSFEGDDNASHFVDGTGVWRTIYPVDITNLETFVGSVINNGDHAATFSSLDITSGGYSAPWPVVTDCSGHTTAGRACYDSSGKKLYVGDGAAAQEIGSGGTGEETDPVVAAITGIVKSNGSTISAAQVGTDYQAPITDPVTGTGTQYHLPYWLTSSSIGSDTGCTTDGAGVITCKTLRAKGLNIGDGNATIDNSGNLLARTVSYIRDDENPFCQQYFAGTNYDDNYTEVCAPPEGFSETYRLYWPTAAPTGNQVLVFPAPTLGVSRGTWQNLADGGDLVSTNNLSDLTDAETARSNLGLVIGTDVLAPNGSAALLTDFPTITEPIVNIALRGGGSAITTGSAGSKRIAAAVTITGYTIISSTSCSITVDLWRTTYTDYDGSDHPANEDSITASAPITLTTAVKAKDETLTGWTKTLSADDIIHVNVDSADCTGDVDIQVYGTRSL